jgi:hypothetical protein
MHPVLHFKTITHHKLLVMKYCFRLGLYRQGLLHDLSKYSPAEFWVGAEYYQGTCSPNNAERRARGCSTAWLHHKGRNKHHFEYWIDYSLNSNEPMCGMEMPRRYVAEMFCDRVAACRVYLGDAYTNASPYDYYEKSKHHYIIHPKTAELIETALRVLKEQGEDAAFQWVRKNILQK